MRATCLTIKQPAVVPPASFSKAASVNAQPRSAEPAATGRASPVRRCSSRDVCWRSRRRRAWETGEGRNRVDKQKGSRGGCGSCPVKFGHHHETPRYFNQPTAVFTHDTQSSGRSGDEQTLSQTVANIYPCPNQVIVRFHCGVILACLVA